MLNAVPKGGKPDTMLEGFQLTMPLYRLPGANNRPFRVGDELMQDSVDLMVDYGGLDAGGQGQDQDVLHQRLSAVRLSVGTVQVVRLGARCWSARP